MLELLTVGSGLCRTSRIKIYWSISKTTDHSYHFDIFSFLSSGSKIPFFPMWESSTKLTERYFCFFFLSIKPCIYPLMPPGTCIFLFGQAGVSFFYCVNFFIMIWWLLSSKVQWVALVSILTYFGSCYIRPSKWNIENAAILYPTLHFFLNIGNSLFVARLLALLWYDTECNITQHNLNFIYTRISE